MGAVLAGPPPVRPAPAPARPQPYPRYSGYSGTRVVIGVGIGGGYYGSGLYGPLGYGLGYSPFGYSGLNYGGLGYGPLGYGYGYPGRSVGVIGVPVIPGSYYATPYQYQSIPVQPIPVQPMVSPDPQPLPLPSPTIQPIKGIGEGKPGTITVITNEGATVTFDGIDTKEAGTRHSFTTKPIPLGSEIRVKVQVDGPDGASSISIGLRSGEKATVDMRK
jgi:uncharacterized protein (TIGR03000 family)